MRKNGLENLIKGKRFKRGQGCKYGRKAGGLAKRVTLIKATRDRKFWRAMIVLKRHGTYKKKNTKNILLSSLMLVAGKNI